MIMKSRSNTLINAILKHTLMALAICLLMIAGGGASLAQSKDREHPTPLKTNEINGEFHQDDPEYFYSFFAQPGDLTFTLDLKAKNYGGALYVTLFNPNGREIGAFDKVVMKGQTARVVKTIKFVKQQPVILRIFSGNGEGYYKLRINNDSDNGQGGSSTPGAFTPGASAGSQSGEPSTDRDNPTPLPSNDLRGEFHQDDPEYFYGLTVEPGTTITFRLNVEAKNYGGALYVTLFDKKGRELGSFDKVVMKGQSAWVVKTIRFEKEQY